MAVELYHYPASLCSQKVRLALAEKGVSWEGHIVDIQAGDNLKPEYLRLNEKAVVPTLVHYGVAVTNSAEILKYIDEKFEGPPLQEGNARLMAALLKLQDILPIPLLTYGRTPGKRGKFIRAQAKKKQRLAEKYRKKHAEFEKVYEDKIRLYRTLEQADKVAPRLREAEERMTDALDTIEEVLNHSDWLGGDKYTLVDAAWTPVLVRLEAVGLGQLLAPDKRPNTADYLDRLRARPSFSQAFEVKGAKVLRPRSTGVWLVGLAVIAAIAVGAYFYFGGWGPLQSRLQQWGIMEMLNAAGF